MKSAKEVIKKFWDIQDKGDYTELVDLFSEDAVFEDPIYGTFNGKNEILGFMKKMNEEMRSRGMVFTARDIDGGGNIAWAQWVAKTPSGDIEGCGLYRVENGMMTYYKDYMNSPPPEQSK